MNNEVNDINELCTCPHVHKDKKDKKSIEELKEEDSYIFTSAKTARNKINELIVSDYRYKEFLQSLIKSINNAIKNGQTRIIFKKHSVELFNTNIYDILIDKGYRVIDTFDQKYYNGPDGPTSIEVPVFMIDF
jgi:hypothetical protein